MSVRPLAAFRGKTSPQGSRIFSPPSLRSLCTLTRSYHGGQLLCPLERTEQVRWSTNPRWEEWLQFDILTANLPRVGRAR